MLTRWQIAWCRHQRWFITDNPDGTITVRFYGEPRSHIFYGTFADLYDLIG